jgi:hypothetical protein
MGLWTHIWWILNKQNPIIKLFKNFVTINLSLDPYPDPENIFKSYFFLNLVIINHSLDPDPEWTRIHQQAGFRIQCIRIRNSACYDKNGNAMEHLAEKSYHLIHPEGKKLRLQELRIPQVPITHTVTFASIYLVFNAWPK